MKPRGQTKRWASSLAAGGLVWAAWAFAAAGGEGSAGDPPPSLRVAISDLVAGEMNANDAAAALRAWSDAVARQTGVRFAPELCTTAQVVQKVRNHQVDALSVNILEFARVASYTSRELVLDETQLPDGEEYVLLVHQSSGIQSLADLRGRSLLLYRNTRTCLDKIWLDSLLASERLGTADTLLGRLETRPKLAHVVLPVFFRQADACLVTLRGYHTMCDLNPQLARQLRSLAVSPKLVTTFMAFHKDCPPETKRRFLAAVADLPKTIAGRQVLMLFGGTRLVQADVSVLRASFEVLHAYERLKGKTPAAGQ